MTNTIRALLSLLITCALWSGTHGDDETSSAGQPAVSFVSQIRPLLSDKCFACHGPDEQTREADLRLDVRDDAVDFGAIEPGHPDDSELVRRILLPADDDERMPPKNFHKDLSQQEIELIRTWIAQGAEYQQHWSYQPLARPTVPNIDHPRNSSPIDAFILASLARHDLQLSPRADRVTLVRRLHFDLLGVPPTYREVQDFLNDTAPDALHRLVDRLLRDHRFGERMAVYWLDLVRYADTIGYHSDNAMEVSAYRDYVINAFNDNKRFDQFTIEQLAGDLLPEPTRQQRIASGYNRLLQTTEEGGAQAKEYLAIYAADRVRNLSGVWMGQTVGCAQCHDHKYDPFTMKDFYSLAAFFADLKENAVGKRKPNMTLLSPEVQAKIDALNAEIAELQTERLLAANEQLADQLDNSQQEWETEIRISVTDQDSAGFGDAVSLPETVLAALRVPRTKRTDEQAKTISDHYLASAPPLQKFRKRLAAAEKELTGVRASLQTMLVSEAVAEPRTMRVLPRGNWLDDSGEIVEPSLPQFLPHTVVQGRRANRLDLAKWLVSNDNPLTARTLVNRLWKLFHGRGLSRNLDDLGGQGEAPTHPQLLDWLAVEFRDSGWDVKHMVRLLVTSSTYAQSSTAMPESLAKDPENQFYGRQGRWRVEAEFVRDTALSISGLLADEITGGRSVKPYQPAGYWQHLNFPKRAWKADDGESLYRRSLYTFWCRTFLHPSMLAFDAPSREECTAERSRSNIPQQALVLLNDPIFLEASRVLAERIVRSSAGTSDRVTWAVRAAMSRDPSPGELALLGSLYEDQQKRYAKSPEDAGSLIGVGAAPVPSDLDPIELAAWTQVARAIINAYETTSRS